MAILSSADWRAAEAIAGIGYVNPFLPERIELERRALGSRHKDYGPIIRTKPGAGPGSVWQRAGNVRAAETLAERLRERLMSGEETPGAVLLVYEDLRFTCCTRGT